MREEILSIASDLREGSMTLKEAQTQLLRLLRVVGRSEQLVCPDCKGTNVKDTDYGKQCRDCFEFM